jgi:trehalose 6-phosphate phosphatase
LHNHGSTVVKEKGVNTLRSEVESQLAPFLRNIAQSSQAALLLDYDGTLAPFHVKRDEARPYPGVMPLLQEIQRSQRTRLVVITGRDVNDVIQYLDLHPRPEIWGIHGLQRLRTDGTLEMPNLNERTLTGLSDAERWLDYQEIRHAAEFKRGSIAVHWRGLNETRVEELRSRVLLGWQPIAHHSGLDLLFFDGGVEIRPTEADKGKAVHAFLGEIGRDTPVAYLGDDTTDEAAFRALHGRGVSVLVRSRWRQTEAQFWFKPPDELIEFLRLWLRTSSGQDAFESGAAATMNR